MNKIYVFLTLMLGLGLAKAALQLDNESELREAQAALFNPQSRSGWLLLNYVGVSTVHFAAGGEGGVEDAAYELDDSQIQYLLVRVQLGSTIRDYFITWIGPNVGQIEKGKKASHFSDAKSMLEPYNNSLVISNRNDFKKSYLSGQL